MLWQARQGFISGRSALDAASGGAFTPSSLTPAGWWEAATSSLFQSNAGTTAATANNDVVGYISDLSGNAKHLTSVADDTTRPTLQGVGTHPLLRFDGTNDILRLASALGLYSGGACSVSIAVKGNPITSARLFGEASSTTSAIYFPLQANSSTATTESAFLRNDAGTAQLAGGTPALTSAYGNTDVVVTVTDNGSTVSAYLDQGTAVTQAYTRADPTTPDRTALGGLLRATASNWFAADVYALVAVNGRVITSTERGNLVTYLGNLQGRTI